MAVFTLLPCLCYADLLHYYSNLFALLCTGSSSKDMLQIPIILGSLFFKKPDFQTWLSWVICSKSKQAFLRSYDTIITKEMRYYFYNLHVSVCDMSHNCFIFVNIFFEQLKHKLKKIVLLQRFFLLKHETPVSHVLFSSHACRLQNMLGPKMQFWFNAIASTQTKNARIMPLPYGGNFLILFLFSGGKKFLPCPCISRVLFTWK